MRQSLSKSSILVVRSDRNHRAHLRLSLQSIGVAKISTATSLEEALERAITWDFTHIFFDARSNGLPAIEFVHSALKMRRNSVLIAISEQPLIDDVLSLIHAGAKGFITPPFTTESLEKLILTASTRPRINAQFVDGPNRDLTLATVIFKNYTRLTELLRYKEHFSNPRERILRQRKTLDDSLEMAFYFSENGDGAIRRHLMELFIRRALELDKKARTSKLGRIRRDLKKVRKIKRQQAIEEQQRILAGPAPSL